MLVPGTFYLPAVSGRDLVQWLERAVSVQCGVRFRSSKPPQNYLFFTLDRWLGTNLYLFIHLPKQENGYIPGCVNNWRGEKPSDIVFYHLNSILCRLRFNKFCQKYTFDLTHTMRISYSKNFQNRWPGIEILKKIDYLQPFVF